MPKVHQMVSLSDQTYALILGSLLGDGSLRMHPGYQNARFCFRHSAKQADYFNWKVAQLKEISGPRMVFKQPADGFGHRPKLLYRSQALPALSEIYKLTHERHKLRIRRKWLNQMDGLSLAVWWLDDGSIIGNTRKGVFTTDGFDQKSVELLIRYLKVVWDINAHLGTVSRKRQGRQDRYFRIWIRSGNELKKLLRIVAPHVHQQNMLYKVLILYKDPELQQRWISELVELTEFSEAVIKKTVESRKLQLKAFQKKI